MMEEEGQNLNKPKRAWVWILVAVIIVALAIFLALPQLKKKPADSPLGPTSKSNEVTYETLAFGKEAATSDPIGDPKGPFYHKVYTATSSDGLTFARTGNLIADKSSVPDVVKTSDGTLFVYVVDGAMRSQNGLMVSASKDNGQTWKSGSLNLSLTDPEYPAAADPQAVLLADGKVRLFFIAFPAKKPPLDSTGKPIETGQLIKVKSAISSDGLNFQEEAGVRYQSTKILTDPDVIQIGSKWFMYLSDGQKNIAFSSADGLSFTEEKTIRQQGSVSKTVALGDGTYRQFFCKNGIASATTKDGLGFTDDPGVRLSPEGSETICDPSPVKLGSGWLMIFKSQK